jgi:hypothetical protein
MDGLALTECRIAHSALKTQFDLVTLVIVEGSVRAHLSREVDDGTSLRNILKSLLEVNEQLEVVFLVHPRTRVSNNSVSTSKSCISWTRCLTSNSSHCRTAPHWLLPTQVVFRRNNLLRGTMLDLAQ